MLPERERRTRREGEIRGTAQLALYIGLAALLLIIVIAVTIESNPKVWAAIVGSVAAVAAVAVGYARRGK